MMKKRILAGLALLCALVLALAGVGDAATTLSATLRLTLSGSYDNALDLQTVQGPLQYVQSVAFTNGTGAGQADTFFSDTRSVAAAEDLDVSGGALTTAYGATFTIAELKMLVVCAAAANTGNVILGGDTASVLFLSTAASTTTLKPGACFVFTDPSVGGTTVTNSTADIIQLAPSAGTQTYSIFLAGSSS